MIRDRDYYQEEYVDKERSLHDIADEHLTHANKIRRELIACGFRTRNRSEAQKAALRSGRHKHPTKGTERPIEVRMKISTSVSKARNDAKNQNR